MVVRLRGVNNAGRSASGSGTLTVNKPSGTVDNEWIIALGSSSGSPNGTIALPAGFTAFNLGGSTFRVAGYKLASSEGASYAFACGNPDDNGAWRAAILTLMGGDPAVPPTIGAVTHATATALTGAGMTLDFGAGALLLCGMEGANNDETVMNAVPPTGFRQILDASELNTTGAGGHAMVFAAMANGLKPGGTGTKAATLNNAKSNTAFLLLVSQAAIAATAPSPVETLLEIDVYDEPSAGVVTQRYSRRGMIYPDHTIYPARIVSDIRIAQHGSDRIALGGRVSLTASEIELFNGELEFDEMMARNLCIGRDVTIKTMPDGNPWSASDGGGGALSGAKTVFKGVVSGVTDRAPESPYTLGPLRRQGGRRR
jgi:hypothetical protein